ncbi:MAG: hypothetical protein GX416_13130 [Bacteroidales bacterium]|nr:hypothetical protein [Bacteroidales bacterium]
MKRFIICILCLFAVISIRAQQVFGPYPMQYNQTIPNGYSKIVVFSTPSYSGGGIYLTESGSTTYLYGSVTYMSIWYYLIPSGIYTVSNILSGYKATVNAQQVSLGSSVNFTSGGYIEFQPLQLKTSTN